MSELKKKQANQKEKNRLMNKDDVYHGALEDILLGKNRLINKDDVYHRALEDI